MNIAGKIWRLDRMLANIVEEIYTGVEHPQPNPEPVSPEQITSAIATLRSLHDAIEKLYGSLRKGGFSNRSLIGSPINSLRAHSDDLLDIAETIELSMNPDIKQVFDKSLDELHRGEVFDLDALG